MMLGDEPCLYASEDINIRWIKSGINQEIHIGMTESIILEFERQRTVVIHNKNKF